MTTALFTQFVPAFNDTPVFITPSSGLPLATVGVPYSQTLEATGGAGGPYSWRLAATSQLPPGLQLNLGVIGGTPTTPSVSSFFLVAQDTAAHRVQQAFSLTVEAASNPVPQLDSINPTNAQAGDADTTLEISGSGFAPASTVMWDDIALPTAFVDGETLGATVPAEDLVAAGSHTITVSSPAPGGGQSAPQSFTVNGTDQNPLPVLTAVSPPQNSRWLVGYTSHSYRFTESYLVAPERCRSTFSTRLRAAATAAQRALLPWLTEQSTPPCRG